ncbi:hypothetical protein ACSS6W_006628 [Trichoderma asperelloides]
MRYCWSHSRTYKQWKRRDRKTLKANFHLGHARCALFTRLASEIQVLLRLLRMNDLRLRVPIPQPQLARLLALSLHQGSSIAPLDPMGTSPPDKKNFALQPKETSKKKSHRDDRGLDA